MFESGYGGTRVGNDKYYNKGYVGKRYYGGCSYVTLLRSLQLKGPGVSLFHLQMLFPLAVKPIGMFMSLMKPGDTFLAMDLSGGG